MSYPIVFTRKVNLGEWTNIDLFKPPKNRKLLVCDASWRGYADYEIQAIWDGKKLTSPDGGEIAGVTYWKIYKTIK